MGCGEERFENRFTNTGSILVLFILLVIISCSICRF